MAAVQTSPPAVAGRPDPAASGLRDSLPTAQPRAGRLGRAPRLRWRGLAPLLVLVVLCVGLAIANPRFVSPFNVARLLNLAAVPLTISMGSTLIILLGSIDLSVEGMVAIAATSLALLGANDQNGNDLGWVAPLAAILLTTVMGLLNGLIQTRLRIPSFMATLGMWFVTLGIAIYMLGGATVRLTDMRLRGLALDRLGGLPLCVYVALAAFGVALFVQYRTRLGRHIVAVGGDEEIARQSGIPTGRVRVLAFALAGAFYGVAGVLAASQLGQSNAVIADGRLFTAITAVVVGGTALTGGEGGVLNSLVGVLIVSVIANGIVLLGISPYVQQTVQGLIIIAAVGISLDRQRLRIVK